MNVNPADQAADRESLLVDLVDEITQRLNLGEPVDIERYTTRHPEIAEQLLQVREALMLVRAPELLSHDEPNTLDSPGSPGQQLGDFRIRRELGRGGMGVVYEAEQLSLNRRVALKVLPFASLWDDRQLQRFKNEAHAAAMLRHPHIVNVFHVGQERGVYFYAMDLIEGQSLAELLASENRQSDGPATGRETGDSSDSALSSRSPYDQQAPPSADTQPIAQLSTQPANRQKIYFRRIARLGVQAAEALHYAHQQGVIHRDIKPANLLIDNHGELHVTDFGLAHLNSETELTLTGDLLGTLRYMSPEQAEGNRVVDHRTDIYSLGLTLYEFATGRPAFTSQHRSALLKQVIESTPVRPAQHCPRIPHDLETIILKAIEKDPAARYASADELAQDLNRFLNNRPVTARRTGPLERLRRWSLRNPFLAALIAIVAVLLFTIAIGSSAGALRLSAQAKLQEVSVYARDIRLVQQAVEEGRLNDAEEALLQWVPADGSTDHRGYEWYHLWRACHDPALVHTIRHQLHVHSLDFLADTGEIAIGVWGPTIYVRNQSDGFRTAVELDTGRFKPIRHVRFLESANTLLSVDADGRAVEWNPQQRCQLREFNLPIRKAASNGFNSHSSPDGTLLAIGGGNQSHGTLVVLDQTTWLPVWQQGQLSGKPWVMFAANGNMIVLNSDSDRLAIYDSETWQLIDERSIESGRVQTVAMSPDRQRLVVAAYRQRGKHQATAIEIWNVAEQRVVERIPFTDLDFGVLRFSPDATWLVAGDDNNNEVFILDAEYQTAARFRPHSVRVSDVEISPDGQFLVTAASDGAVQVWSLPALLRPISPRVVLQEELRFGLGNEFVDNDTVCSSSGKGELLLWNVHTGEVTQRIELEAERFNAVRSVLSHDRRLVGVSMGHWPVPEQPQPGRVQIIELATGQVVYDCQLPRGMSSGGRHAFSQDDRYFVALKGNWLTVLDLSGHDPPREFQLPGNLKAIDFAKDGRTAVVVGMDGMIYQLDVPSFRLLRQQRGDEQALLRSAYSPDGRRLAVVGFDRRVNLFDARTLEPVSIEFSRASRYLVDVRFSPDGKRIVTGSPDGQIQLWHAESGERLLSFDLHEDWYPTVALSPDGKTLAITKGPDALAIHSADQDELKTMSYDELYEIACQHIVEQ